MRRAAFGVTLILWFALVFLLPLMIGAQGPAGVSYVGSRECADCHPVEYGRFMEHANKAKSDHSVRLMAPKLTPEELRECFECHTTGYGQPGGFRSFEETPELGHVGCEGCHGPGSDHVLTGHPDDIVGNLTLEICRPCHEDERVQVINFKPLLYSGAH